MKGEAKRESHLEKQGGTDATEGLMSLALGSKTNNISQKDLQK